LECRGGERRRGEVRRVRGRIGERERERDRERETERETQRERQRERERESAILFDFLQLEYLL
jgi:hypothetical protein